MADAGLPAAYMRGGTSKGVFLLAEDLPAPGPERDDLLLRIMGTPDPMQIDGMGGTFSSTSKVVVVERDSPSSVVYWFAQIGVDRAVVDWSGNCGNLTSAVGPFAIDEGLVEATEPVTRLRLHNGNTGVLVEVEVQVAGGRARTVGDLAVAGVPGTGSPVVTRYLDPSGGALGALFPTGAPSDVLAVEGREITVSILDVTHPYVFVDARAVGLGGDARSVAELNRDEDLLHAVEAIRAACAVRVGAAPTAAEATLAAPITPRIVLVEPDPRESLRATAFSMGQVHRALPMTGALCLAAAALLPGTVVATIAADAAPEVRIRHPRGIATVVADVSDGTVRSVGVVRTARRLMDGTVYPRHT
jgi:hypothetical protein